MDSNPTNLAKNRSITNQCTNSKEESHPSLSFHLIFIERKKFTPDGQRDSEALTIDVFGKS